MKDEEIKLDKDLNDMLDNMQREAWESCRAQRESDIQPDPSASDQTGTTDEFTN